MSLADNRRALFSSVDELLKWARLGWLGPDPTELVVDAAYRTNSCAEHRDGHCADGHSFITIQLGASRGCCRVEPHTLEEVDSALGKCLGTKVSDILGHPLRAVRTAALDAYFTHVYPHPRASGRTADTIVLEGVSLAQRTSAIARASIDSLPKNVHRVLVVGSDYDLCEQLSLRELHCTYADPADSVTVLNELTDASATELLERYDAMVVAASTLCNDTFDALLSAATEFKLPTVIFGRCGSAILPWFLSEPAIVAVATQPHPANPIDSLDALFIYRKTHVINDNAIGLETDWCEW